MGEDARRLPRADAVKRVTLVPYWRKNSFANSRPEPVVRFLKRSASPTFCQQSTSDSLRRNHILKGGKKHFCRLCPRQRDLVVDDKEWNAIHLMLS